MDIYDDFSGDGDLTGRTTATGQTWGQLVEGRVVTLGGAMTRVSEAPGGAYGRLILDQRPFRVRCSVSWSETTDGSVAVISATGQDPNPLDWMVHPIWTASTFYLTVYEDFVASENLLTYAYTEPCTLDAPYEVGWDIEADLLTLHMPDGTVQRFADERIARLSGKHLILQSYNPGAVEQSPRIESVSGWLRPDRRAASAPFLTG